MAASPSPSKSLSIRDDRDGKRTLHIKIKKDFYSPCANFHFKLETFVDFSPPWSKFNGYIVNVQRTDSVNMDCFVTVLELATSKGFQRAINRTFSSDGGVVWHSVSDKQLSEFIIKLTDNMDTIPRKKAAMIVGKQPNSDVYVLSSYIQLDEVGHVIARENWQYIFMPPFLQNLPPFCNESIAIVQVHISDGPHLYDWLKLFTECKMFFGKNFFPFLTFLFGGLAGFHFEKVLNVVGSCPAPMAVGVTGSGKTTALKIIQKLLGARFHCQSSAEAISQSLTKSSIPICWDDPPRASSVKQVLVSTFQGAGRQTKGTGNEIPLTTFLLTVNFHLDDDLRAFERTMPIQFEKITKSADFFSAKKELENICNTDCIPDLIRMGKEITVYNMNSHESFFTCRLDGLPGRLSSIYSPVRFIAHQVIELVNSEDIINKDAFDKYLENDFLPIIASFYGSSTKVDVTIHYVMLKIVEVVNKLKLKKDQVLSWMKRRVQQRHSNTGPCIHLNISKLVNVLSQGGVCLTAKSIRNAANHTKGGSGDFRSKFDGSTLQTAAVKIPREAVEADLLKVIDGWFDEEQQDIIEETPCNYCNNYTEEIERLQSVLGARKVVADTEDKCHQESINLLQTKIKSLESQIGALQQKKPTADKETMTDSDVSVNEKLVTIQDIFSKGESTSLKRSHAEQSVQNEQHKRKTTEINLEKCNICQSYKHATMVMCMLCKQWQHCTCAKIQVRKANKRFVCKSCE